MTDTRQEQTAAQPAAQDGGNRWLSGPFAPVPQEITAFDLPVTGTIPPELNGRLLRIGPNPIDPEDPTTYNWFTGTGMVHGVRLREGRAEWYRNRFVRDDQVVQLKGLPEVPGPRHGTHVPWVARNTVNTNVLGHAGRTWAVAEQGVLPFKLTYELETQTRVNFNGTLNGSFSGHPHRDPVTGELHAMAYYWDWNHLSYHVLATDGSVRKTVDIPVPGTPVVHDVAITERYVVFLDGPVTYDPSLLEQGWTFPYRWNDTYGSRFGLLPLDGEAGDVVWCDADSVAVFHNLNAFDLPDGRVALDGVSYTRVMDADLTGPGEAPSNLDRFILDPVRGRCTVERLDDRNQEMPRHDERLVGRRHRYGYLSSRGADGSLILKHDLETGTTESFNHGRGRAGMEAVFEPRTPDAGEDDGWLMAFVADMTTNTSDVVILHAQDLAAGPVATIHIPQRVPIGFHGNWVSDGSVPPPQA